MASVHLTSSVQRIAADACDFDDARRRLDVLLRRAIGYDFAAFSTVDPATGLWTSCYVSGLDAAGAPERERVLFECELARDVNAFDDLARREVSVATLHAATDGRPTQAKRWAPLLEPHQVVDEARGVLRSNGQLWGTFVLYRAGTPRPFSPVEVSLLTAAVPSIAALFRLVLLRAALAGTPEAAPSPGALTVRGDGTVTAVSTAARAWLDDLAEQGHVPAVVRSLAAAARAAEGGLSVSVPRAGGGFATLHASRVEDTDDTVVVIEAARPSATADVVAEAYRLTDRERDVAALAAGGATTREIARALGISAFTVTDHLKSLYAKVGVTSRGELAAALEQRTPERPPRARSISLPIRQLDHYVG
jgi:DNA-binding CsgD family transcriptional regulator